MGSFGDFLSNGVFIFFLVIAFLIILFLNRKKYIYSYLINERGIEVKYYSVFFKSRKKIIAISGLSELGTTRQKLTGNYSYVFQVKEKGKWIKYETLDAQLKNYIIQNLPVASL
jgi:hypothetical protein